MFSIAKIDRHACHNVFFKMDRLAFQNVLGRPRPIMLKILPIMLLSTAQNYSPLCSKLCSSFLIMLQCKYITLFKYNDFL